ncbi:class I SAM-dependent methyltransferase [Anaerovibrio sp.]|uniref:class I SAM-dependent methyltransferase n=1 Tax=Anaerovibrio sp. TaxID=1872532 RepID=UPI003F15E608
MGTNLLEEQFNRVAGEYDANRKRFIPCFDDYYDGATRFLLSNIRKPAKVLDLGAGTGLLTYHWYKYSPDTEYVLTDVAEEMLAVARQRFAGVDNVSYLVQDYTKELPEKAFDVIMSALSIHHLEDKAKEKLFRDIYAGLPEGGLFVNYDQFCADSPGMSRWLDSYWEGQLEKSGLSSHDIELWLERRKLDRECSTEAELAMLRRCGFRDVQCVYSYHKFSVLVAVK